MSLLVASTGRNDRSPPQGPAVVIPSHGSWPDVRLLHTKHGRVVMLWVLGAGAGATLGVGIGGHP